MKKTIISTLLMSTTMLFVGCYSTKPATQMSTLNRTVNEAKLELKSLGYTEVDRVHTTDNMQNESSEFSNENKVYLTSDTYKFASEDGNTLQFKVSYQEIKSVEGTNLPVVTQVNTSECSVSDLHRYNELCGDQSPIRKIDNMPKDTSVQQADKAKTNALVILLSILPATIIGIWGFSQI